MFGKVDTAEIYHLAYKKDGKVNKSIFDIHVIDVYFTSVFSNPSVFDTSSVAKFSKLETGVAE